MTRNTRILVLLLTLVAMLGVSAASASPLHAHANTQAASCDICISAHLTVLETPILLTLNEPTSSVRHNTPVLALHYEGRWRQPKESRGPPLFL